MNDDARFAPPGFVATGGTGQVPPFRPIKPPREKFETNFSGYTNKDLQHLRTAMFWADNYSKDDPETRVGAMAIGELPTDIAMGYNGFPPGIADDVRRQDRHLKDTLTVHAEINALANARFNVHTLYVTHTPCERCAPTILAMARKLKRIVTIGREPYDSKWATSIQRSLSLFEEARVAVDTIPMSALYSTNNMEIHNMFAVGAQRCKHTFEVPITLNSTDELDDKIVQLRRLIEKDHQHQQVLTGYMTADAEKRLRDNFPHAKFDLSFETVRDWHNGRLPHLILNMQKSATGIDLTGPRLAGDVIVLFESASIQIMQHFISRLNRGGKQAPIYELY